MTVLRPQVSPSSCRCEAQQRKGDDLSPCDMVGWPGPEEQLWPRLILSAVDTGPCGGWSPDWGGGSASTTMTPSRSPSAESPAVNGHKVPLRADMESVSGAQRVKNVSSSNREYSEWSDLCWSCVLGLAGVLVSGILSWTATVLMGSGDTTATA